MNLRTVKGKFLPRGPLVLGLLALISFGAARAGWLPADAVENGYSRVVFPVLSGAIARAGEIVLFSWLDVLVPVAFCSAVYLIYRRRPATLVGLTAAGYLFFFWTWGLNYHRLPLVSKLDFEAGRVTPAAIRNLAEEAARELNALYPEQSASLLDEATLRVEANRRISRVLNELDGSNWGRAVPVKTSRVLDPFFRAAGVDGMFNPFGYEPLVTSGLLPFERPMVMLHEIAHVRGYPHEGDANFLALLGAVHSGEPLLRYSGWLTLWLYLRNPELDRLLDDGPRADLRAIFDRIERQRVAWLSRAQTRTLDLFLRAHDVEGGVRAYAEIVRLAAGVRHSWDRFAD